MGIGFLRLAGLLPGIAGLFTTAAASLVVRFSSTAVAGKLAVTLLRTIGRVQNVSGFLPGLPIPATPVTRLFPSLVGFPFTGGAGIGLNSFLAGFAYRDNEELVRGWTSFFGELALKDVPLVEGNLETALRRLGDGDFVGFGEAAANAFSEDIGLASVGAFFRGLSAIERDFQQLGLPTAIPAPWVFGGLFAVVNFFDSLITKTGRDLGGLFEDPGRRRPKPVRPDPALQNFLDDLRDPSRTLPTTPMAIRRSLVTFRRSISRFRAARGILELLKSQEGREELTGKLARLVGLS